MVVVEGKAPEAAAGSVASVVVGAVVVGSPPAAVLVAGTVVDGAAVVGGVVAEPRDLRRHVAAVRSYAKRRNDRMRQKVTSAGG